MPLYELFCIAAHNPTSPVNLRQLIEGLAKQIHNNGGVVRDIKSLGIGKTLPKRVRRQQQFHTRGELPTRTVIWVCADGSHFLMQFDTSPGMIKEMDQQLNRDPLVIRWTVLKKGTKLYVDCAARREEPRLIDRSSLLPENPFSIEYAEPSARATSF